MTGPRRSPTFLVDIYDIRSTASDPTPTRINDVVLLNLGVIGFVPDIVGPRSFTDDVERIDMTEVAGDYVTSGVAASTLTVRIIDADGTLDPVSNPPTAGDPEADGRWLRQGNVIVIREGDANEPDESAWPITFTGKIQGQPGQNRNRTTLKSELTAKAASREVDYLRFLFTSASFAQGTTYEALVLNLAQSGMGLDFAELDIATFGAATTPFRTTQFVAESALTSIAKILFTDGLMPRFLGNGQLGSTDGNINKGPVRTYPTDANVQSLTRPILEFNGTNHVTVTGLDGALSKIAQERQELATASVTSGFFSRDITIPVQWSDDKTQQADDVRMVVLASVGDSLINFGSESFTNFPQSDGGSVDGQVNADGAYSSKLVALVVSLIISSAFAPDFGIGLGVGVTTVTVLRPGGLVSMLFISAAQFILTMQARGQYRIEGAPYEYVFRELVGIARKKGVRPEDQQEVRILNHLLNSQQAVNEAAERVYRRERAKQNLRSVRLIHDLKLEPDDVFAVGTGSTQRRYMIQSISRSLRRGGDALANINCFEVTSGVLP